MYDESSDEELGHAESADSSETPGYVYVATNPAMPGIVKIGRTSQDDPESRISQLFNTSVPVPFDLEYAAAVPGDPKQVENALHVAFGPQRVHPNREFFKIDPEQAIAVLQLIDARDITDDVQAETDVSRSLADRQASKRLRRPNLDFGELGLAPGTALTFEQDDRVRIEIVDAQQVRLIEMPSDVYPSLGTEDGPTRLSPPSAGSTGGTPNASTATSTTSALTNSKRPTLRPQPTTTRQETTTSSLRKTQGESTSLKGVPSIKLRRRDRTGAI